MSKDVDEIKALYDAPQKKEVFAECKRMTKAELAAHVVASNTKIQELEAELASLKSVEPEGTAKDLSKILDVGGTEERMRMSSTDESKVRRLLDVLEQISKSSFPGQSTGVVVGNRRSKALSDAVAKEFDGADPAALGAVKTKAEKVAILEEEHSKALSNATALLNTGGYSGRDDRAMAEERSQRGGEGGVVPTDLWLSSSKRWRTSCTKTRTRHEQAKRAHIRIPEAKGKSATTKKLPRSSRRRAAPATSA